VRTLSKACLFVILGAALLGTPVFASPASPASAPLGVVLQATYAQVGADTTAGGATVYDGDRLQTTGSGTLRAQLGGPQIFMRQNTVAQVHGLPKGFSGELAAGSLVISATDGQTFSLITDGVTIRPAGTQGTVAEITRVSPTEVLLTSSHGALQVTMDDEVKIIESGTSYRMEVDADESGPGPQPQGPQHTGRRRRLAFYLIIGGVAAATGILVWRALESPSGL
jgi:hypothetical protein